MNVDTSKIKFISSMVIFGTIGLFVRLISFPSSVISMCRGFLGAAFLIIFILIAKNNFSFKSVKNNLLNLVLSGGLIGINWILLFESYRYTSVAKATLCHNMAPIFVVIVSPFVFKERLTIKKGISVVVAFIGMLLVSGVFEEKSLAKGEIKGIILGLASAVTYAVIISLNKKLIDIGAFEKTIVQLLVCGATTLVYSLVSSDIAKIEFSVIGILAMLLVCVLHTGIAYLFYFGSMDKIKAQTIAILSYVDPVIAVLVSAIILKEQLGVYGIIGAVLIIGSAISA